MSPKILIILIILIALGVGGFFIYKNLFLPEAEKEKIEEEKEIPEEQVEEQSEEQAEEEAVLPEEKVVFEKEEEEIPKEEEKKPASIPVQITFLEKLAADPSWSPDGSKIVFLSLEKDQMKGGLYMINSDGTGLTSIGPWGTRPSLQSFLESG